MFMLYAAFFITITLAVYAVYAIPNERKQRVKNRLAHIMGDGKGTASNEAAAATGAAEEKPALIKRMLGAVFTRFRRRFRQRIDERKQEKIDLLILQAGRPHGMSVVEFRLVQMALLAACPAIGILYSVFLLRLSLGVTILIVFGAVIAAWRLPYVYLSGKIKKRGRKAIRELPDALDLLTVSLEAGLGFDSALGKLASKKEGVLTTEFHRCLEEIRLGRTRREALIGVRDRVPIDEMRSLVGSILQAEKLGVGMVQVLRVQSSEMRDRRKQRAEEQAMKAPIKMLFPLVIFVFPCLFIVLLGPILIQFVETFSGS
ncbi:type II secretion system F family protein [Paenibacillus alkalitolerans]|uniref:type II secretion system F family protein n=1 Tax=Paenibacillus alkalitolerans TaxID=2799335 RepID=UPI001F1DD22B|nr:type II secretion system F family protein [Paenibacillus alkalitolerans]